MKSSNLAWRIESFDEHPGAQPDNQEAQPAQYTVEIAFAEAPARVRPRFARRTIEIRDPGFAPFRIR